MRHVSLLSTLALSLCVYVACQEDLRLHAPRPEDQVATLAGEDIPIFQAVFRHLQPGTPRTAGKYLVVCDRTVRFCSTPLPFKDPFYLPDDLMKRTESKGPLMASLESELRKNFSSRNTRFASIPRFSTQLPTRLVSPDTVRKVLDDGFWPAFYHMFPDAGGFACFSLPAYTRNRGFSLVYVSMASGGLQGVEYVFWLARQNSLWTVTTEQIISLS